MKQRFFIFLFFLNGLALFAQPRPVPGNYIDNFVQGNFLIEEKNWPMALLYFQEAYKVDSSNANINYKMGLCLLNSASRKTEALYYLKKSSKEISKNYDPFEPRIKKAPETSFYYLAQAYHLNNKFDSALIYFETYKTLLSPKNTEMHQDINLRMEWCKNAKEFTASPIPVTITNLGDSINGPLPDYGAVVSLDENTIYFTSRRFGERDIDGQYYEDILMSERKEDGTWTTARPISPYINTITNEATISLSTDGQTLFIYRDDNGGDIYTSTQQNGQWQTAVPIGGYVNTQYWETHACVTADGNTLYFVSDRPGGFGGRDIYRCVKLPNGQWSKATNMGPTINTPYDEDAPFLHPDQSTLYFSSKGHKSMGGFDIFFTVKNDSGMWLPPTNVGYPLNTPDDDVFYMTSPDGKRAYFSSVREGGFGEKDLYMATLEQAPVEALTLLKGRIYNADGSPLTQKIDIIVYNTLNGEKIGEYHPNSRTGRFAVILPSGGTYQISYLVDDKEMTNEIIDVPLGSEFEVIDRAIDLRDLVLGKLHNEVPVDKPADKGDVKPKDWKAQLTETQNLNFSMKFKYNISSIDPKDPDFKIFIDSCVAHINKFGEINFRVTAAASQVPTKKFPSNKALAQDRAKKAQDVVNKALEAKGVDMSKVHWVKINAYVLGPQYKDDFQKRKNTYEKYQYVKIRGY
ncbi:MAG: hypothetical protein Fur0041_23190 [Bacteroidia bacterium]